MRMIHKAATAFLVATLAAGSLAAPAMADTHTPEGGGDNGGDTPDPATVGGPSTPERRRACSGVEPMKAWRACVNQDNSPYGWVFTAADGITFIDDRQKPDVIHLVLTVTDSDGELVNDANGDLSTVRHEATGTVSYRDDTRDQRTKKLRDALNAAQQQADEAADQEQANDAAACWWFEVAGQPVRPDAAGGERVNGVLVVEPGQTDPTKKQWCVRSDTQIGWGEAQYKNSTRSTARDAAPVDRLRVEDGAIVQTRDS